MLEFVRWKKYGFTHIVREEEPPMTEQHSTIYRGTTLCGNPWARRHWIGQYAYRNEGFGPGEDDGQRPLCGACTKIAKLT